MLHEKTTECKNDTKLHLQLTALLEYFETITILKYANQLFLAIIH